MQKAEVIRRQNRDRPGGHHFRTFFGHLDSNLNGGGEWKKIVKRKARRNHKKVIAEGYLDSVLLIEDIQDYVRFNNLYDEEWEYFDEYDYDADDWEKEYNTLMVIDPYVAMVEDDRFYNGIIEDNHDRWDREEQAWFAIEMGYYSER